MNKETNGAPGKSPKKRRPFLKGMVTGGLASILIASGIGAFAGYEGHSHSRKGECRHGKAMRDPGVVRERADYMVERALSKIDATPEQRTQVKSVVRTAIDELFPLREEHKANRKAMIAALSKTEVDREELDRIRNAEMAVFDRGSKAIMTALADSADVLSPEQRAQLAEMAGRWAGGRRHGF